MKRILCALALLLVSCETANKEKYASFGDDPYCTAFADGKLKAHKRIIESAENAFSVIRRREYWKESYRECMDFRQPADYCQITANNDLKIEDDIASERNVVIPEWRRDDIYQSSYNHCKQTYSLENYCSSAAGGRLARYEEELSQKGGRLFEERRNQVFRESYSQCLESFGQSAMPVFRDDLGTRTFNNRNNNSDYGE